MKPKILLWILAIAAILGPCMLMSSGSTKMMGASMQMALVSQMKQQTLMLESQFSETLYATRGADDTSFLKNVVDQMNSANASGPADKEMMKREGVNPAMMPKPLTWLLAPAKDKRSLSLGLDSGTNTLVILGWGSDLEKPIFEKQIPLGSRPGNEEARP